MVTVKKYDFSFTGLSLRLNVMLKVAEAFREKKIITKEELGDGNRETGRKRLNQASKRLKQFSDDQQELFINGDLIAQQQMAFFSVCKVHAFIREFTVEVLREKILVFDYELTDGEYISFYRRKIELHPEMEDLTQLTQNKIRQVTFKILEQAGLIDNVKSKQIQPQIIDKRVVEVIAADNAEWLKIFLMSDLDIVHFTK